MTARWATFDCYGTLIDWNRGIGDALTGLWPYVERERLLARYHAVEPLIQEGRSVPYRNVLMRGLRAVAAIEGLPLQGDVEYRLVASLPSWPPFPDVAGALNELRERGWRLAILSNTDPDLLQASLRQLEVPVDLTVTARDVQSYKPATGHWERFRQESGVDPSHHVHVAASLFHDIAPAAELGIRAVWINRLGETSDLPRVAELPDLTQLPNTLERIAGPV